MRDDPRRRRPYESTPRSSRVHQRRKPRTRLPAVIVLVVAAVILLVVGLAGRSSDSAGSGGGETTPFSVLPVAPQNISTTIETASALPVPALARGGGGAGAVVAGAFAATNSREGFSTALQ